jgi:hypothetical protein
MQESTTDGRSAAQSTKLTMSQESLKTLSSIIGSISSNPSSNLDYSFVVLLQSSYIVTSFVISLIQLILGLSLNGCVALYPIFIFKIENSPNISRSSTSTSTSRVEHICSSRASSASITQAYRTAASLVPRRQTPHPTRFNFLRTPRRSIRFVSTSQTTCWHA